MERKNSKVVVIDEALVDVCGGCETQAMILNQFLYWEKRVNDFNSLLQEVKQSMYLEYQSTNFLSGWIYKSSNKLKEELMVKMTTTSLRKYVDKLVTSGLLLKKKNPYPNHPMDKTLLYRVDINRLMLELDKSNFFYPKNLQEIVGAKTREELNKEKQ